MDQLNFTKTKVYVTGSSRGLGKAIASEFLAKGSKVVGMSRSSSIQHLNYSHLSMDLSDIETTKKVHFEIESDFDNVVLINNAGTLGEVKPFFSLEEETIINTINLNYIAPLLLIKKFYQLECNQTVNRYVLNIGTGAANRAMDGWSLYCSSKAALQMFDEVINKENLIHNKQLINKNLKPGVIDTEMQSIIRESEEENFSSKELFLEYFENDKLQSAQQIARVIISNFINLFEEKETIISINELKNK